MIAMPAKLYPADIFEQGRDVLEAWRQIDAALTLPDLSLVTLENELATIPPILTQISALETQLTNLRNQRDAVGLNVWEKVKRIRNTIKGMYGDDSSQYEMVGGTRRSDRKPATRKPKSG
jgi:hypothetical protein